MTFMKPRSCAKGCCSISKDASIASLFHFLKFIPWLDNVIKKICWQMYNLCNEEQWSYFLRGFMVICTKTDADEKIGSNLCLHIKLDIMYWRKFEREINTTNKIRNVTISKLQNYLLRSMNLIIFITEIHYWVTYLG